MTNLPQTIKKTVNIITGLEVVPGTVDSSRATGRTTAIILHGISEAIWKGSCRIEDHCDYPAYSSHNAALNMCLLAEKLVKDMGLKGISVELSSYGHEKVRTYGCLIQSNVIQEVFYDLRK